MSRSANNEVVDVINNILAKYNVSLKLKRNAPMSGHQLISFIYKEDNPITQFLLQTIPTADLTVTYFRCMKTEHAIQSLYNKSFRMSNIIANNSNDYAEFSEFFKRMGLFGSLIPEQFCNMRCKSNGIYCHNSLPNRKPKIDSMKDNSFILCFSKDITDKMWDNYCDGHRGVIFEVEISKNCLSTEIGGIVDFRDVFYDSGYDLEFINEIQNELKIRFGRELFIEGITRFSYFYKRVRYKEEHETRIVLQNPTGYAINNSPYGQYIEYPIGSQSEFPYCITVKTVHLGKNVPQKDKTEIQKILYANPIGANIQHYS